MSENSEAARRAHCQPESAECCWRSSACSRQHLFLEQKKHLRRHFEHALSISVRLKSRSANFFNPSFYTRDRLYQFSRSPTLHFLCVQCQTFFAHDQSRVKASKTASSGDLVETAEVLGSPPVRQAIDASDANPYMCSGNNDYAPTNQDSKKSRPSPRCPRSSRPKHDDASRLPTPSVVKTSANKLKHSV